jgi:hypothetical protein
MKLKKILKTENKKHLKNLVRLKLNETVKKTEMKQKLLLAARISRQTNTEHCNIEVM